MGCCQRLPAKRRPLVPCRAARPEGAGRAAASARRVIGELEAAWDRAELTPPVALQAGRRLRRRGFVTGADQTAWLTMPQARVVMDALRGLQQPERVIVVEIAPPIHADL